MYLFYVNRKDKVGKSLGLCMVKRGRRKILFFGCAAEETDGENGHIVFGAAASLKRFF